MKRYGFVIKSGGDPEIAGALVAGMEQGLRQYQPRHSAAVRRLDMQRHTREELIDMIADARMHYGQTRRLPRWADRLLGMYGLMCYCVSLGWRRLLNDLGL